MRMLNYFRPGVLATLVLLSGCVSERTSELADAVNQADASDAGLDSGTTDAGLDSVTSDLGLDSDADAADAEPTWQVTSYQGQAAHVRAIGLDVTGLYVFGTRGIYALDTDTAVEKRALGDGAQLWTALSAQGSTWTSMAVGSTGVYIAGSNSNGFWAINKLDLTAGTPIPAFGTNGEAESTTVGAPTLLAIDTSSAFLVGIAPGGWLVEKRALDTGELVPAFGASGVKAVASTEPISLLGAVSDAVSLYVLLVRSGTSAAIEKRSKADGSLIASFGTGGSLAILPPLATFRPNDFHVYGDQIFMVGTDEATAEQERWRMQARQASTGALEWDQTNAPVELNGVLQGRDVPRAGAADSTYLYVAGGEDVNGVTGNSQARVEKRSVVTGELVGFPLVLNPTSDHDWFTCVRADGSSLFLAGEQPVSHGKAAWWIARQPVPR